MRPLLETKIPLKMMSNDEYAIKLNYLEINDPDNFMIAKLRTGYSMLNVMYLMQELKDIEARPPKEKVKANPKASAMEIKLRHLRQSRDELSNSFMQCVTDHQRAAVSMRIGELTKQIVDLAGRLDTFVETQEIAAELPKNDKFPIPEDGFELAKLQHSNRNNIRRATERINDLFAIDPNDKRIRELETKLRNLKIHKQYIDVEINRRKNI